jgi:hypothetical protein
MKILGRASSINVRKVLWTSAEIGLAVEREDRGAGFRSTRDESLIVLGVSTHRWISTPIERPALPAVSDWFASVSQRSAYVAQTVGAHP